MRLGLHPLWSRSFPTNATPRGVCLPAGAGPVSRREGVGVEKTTPVWGSWGYHRWDTHLCFCMTGGGGVSRLALPGPAWLAADLSPSISRFCSLQTTNGSSPHPWTWNFPSTESRMGRRLPHGRTLRHPRASSNFPSLVRQSHKENFAVFNVTPAIGAYNSRLPETR